MNKSLMIGLGIGWASVVFFGYIAGTIVVGVACVGVYFVKDD